MLCEKNESMPTYAELINKRVDICCVVIDAADLTRGCLLLSPEGQSEKCSIIFVGALLSKRKLAVEDIDERLELIGEFSQTFLLFAPVDLDSRVGPVSYVLADVVDIWIKHDHELSAHNDGDVSDVIN